MTSDSERWVAAFDDLEKELGRDGGEWLAQTRRAAIAKFAERGFPTTRDEEWRYTPTAPITRTVFAPAPAITTLPRRATVDALTGRGDGDPVVTFVNGHFAPELTTTDGLPVGVELMSIAAAVRRDPVPPWLADNLGKVAGEGSAFTCLNSAFLTDGVCLNIPEGVIIDRPVHFTFVAAGAAGATPWVSHPRILIVAGARSEVSIVESWVSPDAGFVYLNNPVTEVRLGPGAQVEHLKLQTEAETAYHVASLTAHIGRDASFTQRSFSLGAALMRFDVNVIQDGPGVTCTLDGLFLAAGSQHVDHHTAVDHAKPHGTSLELYKGILDGAAVGVFNGKVIVRPDAQKTDSRQTNKNLLLSRDAVIETKPELEIYADDVKCAHGATIGQLDERALFYLRSRGIGKAEARSTLIYAFAAEMVARVRHPTVRDRLATLLVERLPGASPELRGDVGGAR